MEKEMSMQKHFVEYLSPGIFMSEVSSREIASWDVPEAVKMMRDIVERHGARPYGFRFYTMSRQDDDLNASRSASSHIYFVNCDVLTAEEILAGTNPADRILRLNVEGNKIKRIARTRHGYLVHYPMSDNDEVIEAPELVIHD